MSTTITEVITDAGSVATLPAIPKPVEKSERIKTIDMVRGVALLGILLMNIPIFSFNDIIYQDLFNGDRGNADFRTYQVIVAFFDGTMRGLFSMLFGAGMVLFLVSKKEKPGGPSVAELYFRRLLWLVVFGLINAYILQWPGDILFYYGLLGMLLYPFRTSSPKLLIGMGLLLMFVFMYRSQWNYSNTREIRVNYNLAIQAEKQGKKLTPKQEEQKQAWLNIEKNRVYDRDIANENIARMRGSYLDVFDFLLPLNARNEFVWLYYWAFWDCLFMMFMGMALFKLGFFSDVLANRTYWLTLLIGYGIGLPLGYLYMRGSIASNEIGPFLDRYRVSTSIVYDIRRLLLSLGHISLMMLIYRSRIVPWLMVALAAVGQMAFSNYLMQSIFCAIFFYGWGFGYFHQLRYYQIYYVVFAIWIFQLIFSVIWLKYFRFGPFEWTWRSLTYWKKQKMI